MTTGQDLKELLRKKGKTQSEVGLTQGYVSFVANGRVRAGVEAIATMAGALGCTTEEVCAACDESHRRAQQGDLAAVTPAAGSPVTAATSPTTQEG